MTAVSRSALVFLQRAGRRPLPEPIVSRLSPDDLLVHKYDTGPTVAKAVRGDGGDHRPDRARLDVWPPPTGG